MATIGTIVADRPDTAAGIMSAIENHAILPRANGTIVTYPMTITLVHDGTTASDDAKVNATARMGTPAISSCQPAETMGGMVSRPATSLQSSAG